MKPIKRQKAHARNLELKCESGKSEYCDKMVKRNHRPAEGLRTVCFSCKRLEQRIMNTKNRNEQTTNRQKLGNKETT